MGHVASITRIDEIILYIYVHCVQLDVMLCSQSRRSCDEFPFLPSVHVRPPGHGHRLLGRYRRVS